MGSLLAPLTEADPQIAAALAAELARQEQTLEMIASENVAPLAVLQAQGSVATNKYAEGYPGRRYYAGCEHVDVVETLAIERLRTLFGAAHANVQPHSGAQANMAVLFGLLPPGATILGLDLAHGGHLSHGMRLNYSGRSFTAVPYHVDAHGWVDMAEVAALARERRPALIIAGWSAYPRHLDFAQFRAIADEVDALLMVDMAHFAGLVAAGLHPNPVPHAHVTTSTTHKTLGGPRGGVIMTDDPALAKRIDSAVFPGLQGGPLQHVIAAKAVAFRLAATEEFADRQRRALAGAQLIAGRLATVPGLAILTGGTDVHLVMVDLTAATIDGRIAEQRLHGLGITVNRNAVPHDPRPPLVTSGLRIGTPALATRGFDTADFAEVAEILASALDPDFSDGSGLRRRVEALAARRPLYAGAVRQ